MEKNKYDEQEKPVEFRKSLFGYNPVDVDPYIEALISEVDELKKELSDLQDRFEQTQDQLNGYKHAEKAGKDLISEAKEEHDRIIKDAKSRAAHVIMRTSRQCNRIVADMISQVEEQKNIYDATRKEVIRFRSVLFGEYSDHIKKINAFVEAAGAFDADAVNEEDLTGIVTMLRDEVYTDGKEDAFDVSDEVREEVERIKTDAIKKAEKIVGINKGEDINVVSDKVSGDDERYGCEKSDVEASDSENTAEEPEYNVEADIGSNNTDHDVNGSTPACETEPVVELENAAYGVDLQHFEQAPALVNEKNEPKDVLHEDDKEALIEDFYDEEEEEYRKALKELEETVRDIDDDSDEYVDHCETPGAVSEYDGVVQVSGVFDGFDDYYDKKTEYSENESYIDEEVLDEQPYVFGEDVEEGEAAPVVGEGYGFNIVPEIDDDEDEFYHEDDDEFVIGASEGDLATSESGISIEIPKAHKDVNDVKRWRVKKSMSLTDEFDIIKAENDE